MALSTVSNVRSILSRLVPNIALRGMLLRSLIVIVSPLVGFSLALPFFRLGLFLHFSDRSCNRYVRYSSAVVKSRTVVLDMCG